MPAIAELPDFTIDEIPHLVQDPDFQTAPPETRGLLLEHAIGTAWRDMQQGGYDQEDYRAFRQIGDQARAMAVPSTFEKGKAIARELPAMVGSLVGDVAGGIAGAGITYLGIAPEAGQTMKDAAYNALDDRAASINQVINHRIAPGPRAQKLDSELAQIKLGIDNGNHLADPEKFLRAAQDRVYSASAMYHDDAGHPALNDPQTAMHLGNYMATGDPAEWKAVSDKLAETKWKERTRQTAQDILQSPGAKKFSALTGLDSQHLVGGSDPVLWLTSLLPAARGANVIGAGGGALTKLGVSAAEQAGFGVDAALRQNPEATQEDIAKSSAQMIAMGGALHGVGAGVRRLVNGKPESAPSVESGDAVVPPDLQPGAARTAPVPADAMDAHFEQAMGGPEQAGAMRVMVEPEDLQAGLNDLGAIEGDVRTMIPQREPMGGEMPANEGVPMEGQPIETLSPENASVTPEAAPVRTPAAPGDGTVVQAADAGSSPATGGKFDSRATSERMASESGAAQNANEPSPGGLSEAEIPVKGRFYRGENTGNGRIADDEPGGIHFTQDQSYARQYGSENLRESDVNLRRALDFRTLGEKFLGADVIRFLDAHGVDTNGKTQAWFNGKTAREVLNALPEIEAATIHQDILDGMGHLIKEAGFDGYLFAEVGDFKNPSVVVFSEKSLNPTGAEGRASSPRASESPPISDPARPADSSAGMAADPAVAATVQDRAQTAPAFESVAPTTRRASSDSTSSQTSGAGVRATGFTNLDVSGSTAGFLNADLINEGASLIARGVRDFAAWSRAMLSRFGSSVRDHLQRLWRQITTREAKRVNLGRPATIVTERRPEGGFIANPLKEDAKFIAEKFGEVPKFTPFRAALNGWIKRNQTTTLEVNSLMKEMERRVPDAVKREGITNWIQAAGDDSLLAAREAASTGKRKAGYRAARNLTPEELAAAGKVRDYYDKALARAQAAGVMKTGLQNYVNQVWEQPGSMGGRGKMASFQGQLAKNFKFGQNRTFESFFEGEQAGFTPATKDVSKLMGLYLSELSKTIATRHLIADLTTKAASDGRPLAAPTGGAINLDGTKMDGEVTLVLPGAKGKVKFNGADYETKDYRTVDNPALASWKFATSDTEGKPVVVMGQLALHPEAHTIINRALTGSKIKDWVRSPADNIASHLARRAVGAVDSLQSQIKASMMSLSPFHVVQEGTHAIGHKVNPFTNLPQVDPSNPAHADAMNHGLMLAAERVGAEAFMDGLTGRGSWLERIPGIGGVVKSIGDFTFHTYIPALKLKTYDHIVQRNTMRFADELRKGEITLDDIKYLSGKQTNAAYGHLNYKDMGRDPTIQHLLRAVLLAPDFLEARAKFTGQAIQGVTNKLGREQLAAMATLATTFFVGARAMNAALNNGDMKFDHPFGVVAGNRTYTMRSVPEDIYRMFHDPMQFASGRVAPVIGTGALEMLFGVNRRGEKVTTGEAAQDVLVNAIPMSLRMVPGLRNLTSTQKNHPVSPWEQFLGAAGVQIGRHSPITAQQREAMAFAKATGVEDRGSYPVSKYQQLRYALEDLNWDKAAEEIKTLKGDKGSRQKLSEGFHSSLFRPWTGSKDLDHQWKSTLKPEQKQTLELAEQRRKDVWARYVKMLAQ